MAQKRRKGAVNVTVLLPVELIREIDDRVKALRLSSRTPVLSRAEWIKRAIFRDLDHDKRSRRRKDNGRAILSVSAGAGDAGGRPEQADPAPSPGDNPGVPAVPAGAEGVVLLHAAVSDGAVAAA